MNAGAGLLPASRIEHDGGWLELDGERIAAGHGEDILRHRQQLDRRGALYRVCIARSGCLRKEPGVSDADLDLHGLAEKITAGVTLQILRTRLEPLVDARRGGLLGNR